MKVLLTGATGYIGNSLISYLLRNNIEIRAFIRPSSVSKFNKEIQKQVEMVAGDVTDISSITDKLHGIDSVVYLPGLIREFPNKGITFRSIHFEGVKNLVDEALRSDVKRFILISANGVRPDASTAYHKTKYEGEEYLKRSGLEWTIFRPSVIFGDEEKGYQNFITVIIELINMFPYFVPVIGSGKYRFQPIHIHNLSEVIIKCLRGQETIGKVFYICGKEIFSYNELIDRIASFVGKKKIRIHIPVGLMKIISRMLENYIWFPVTNAQIKMMLEENVCPIDVDIFTEFNIKPILFGTIFKSSK